MACLGHAFPLALTVYLSGRQPGAFFLSIPLHNVLKDTAYKSAASTHVCTPVTSIGPSYKQCQWMGALAIAVIQLSVLHHLSVAVTSSVSQENTALVL